MAEAVALAEVGEGVPLGQHGGLAVDAEGGA